MAVARNFFQDAADFLMLPGFSFYTQGLHLTAEQDVSPALNNLYNLLFIK